MRIRGEKDVLAIETELNRVQADIDSMEGRIKSLKGQADFATVTLALERRPVKEHMIADGLFIGMAARDMARAKQSELAGERAVVVAEQARSQVDQMQVDINRLMLCTQALWELLKEQQGFTEEQLIGRITEIDMRDGKLDGKLASQGPLACPKCGRPNTRTRVACIYCGTVLPQDPFAQ